MTYAFKCLTCGTRHEAEFAMSDDAGRKRLVCGTCGGTFGRDFTEVQFRFRTGWREVTQSDALPDDVKGAGPHSKAHRDYAGRSHGRREV
jgi:predicted nucleic acid-binding Zn ribbon protein